MPLSKTSGARAVKRAIFLIVLIGAICFVYAILLILKLSNLLSKGVSVCLDNLAGHALGSGDLWSSIFIFIICGLLGVFLRAIYDLMRSSEY